jgi:U3 small nucleolar ribonucleoprotein protein LCP5
MDEAATKVANQVDALSMGVEALQANIRKYMSGSAVDGMRLLDVKTSSLLRYAAALCRYGASRVGRASDESVEAAVADLVREWVAIERTRPLEKAVRPRVSALLERSARPRVSDKKGKTAARPDPGNLAADDDEDEDGRDSDAADAADIARERDDVYRPPRIAEVLYDGEREAIEEREAKAREKMAARAARSRSVREMLAEFTGRPDEVRDEDGDGDGFAGREMTRMRREEEERTQYEEENMTRLNMTRKDMKRRKMLEHAAERVDSGTGDPFSELMGVADRVIGKGAAGSAAHRAGQDRADALSVG